MSRCSGAGPVLLSLAIGLAGAARAETPAERPSIAGYDELIRVTEALLRRALRAPAAER